MYLLMNSEKLKALEMYSIGSELWNQDEIPKFNFPETIH